MNEITLKNGAVVAETAVKPIMMNLELCQLEDPIAFRELVSVCLDPAHVPLGNTGGKLKALSLLEGDGRVRRVVRDVVISAVSGEDTDMTLGSPYAETSMP